MHWKRDVATTQLAQLGERRSAEREVMSLNPGRTNTQGLNITEEKVLSLWWHLQMIGISSLLGEGR